MARRSPQRAPPRGARLAPAGLSLPGPDRAGGGAMDGRAAGGGAPDPSGLAAPSPAGAPGPAPRGSEEAGGGAWRLLDGLAAALNAAGVLLILAIMGMMAVDIGGRALLNAPLRGTGEMAGLLIVSLVFLMLPLAVARARMIRSEMLLAWARRRAPRLGRTVEALFDAVGALFFGAMAYAVWPSLFTAWERGSYVGAQGGFTAPVWPKLAAVALGAALGALIFATRAARALRGAPPPPPPEAVR